MCIDSAIARDIIVGMAAIFTVGMTFYGLKSWWRELRGRANFDVARGLMRSVYKVRNNVESCRVLFISIGEYPKKYQSKNPLSSKEEAEAYNYALQNRWNRVHESIHEFDAQSLEAEVLWGDNIKSKTDKLRECLQELKHAISEVIEDKALGGSYFEGDPGYGEEMKSVVFSKLDQTKEFSNRFAGAVTGIEDDMRRYFQRHS